MGMVQNPVPLVNPKIAGKWMFIPLKMVLIGIDPYPNESWINHGMNTSNSDHATRSPCCLGISSLESMVMFKLMKLREANNILHWIKTHFPGTCPTQCAKNCPAHPQPCKALPSEYDASGRGMCLSGARWPLDNCQPGIPGLMAIATLPVVWCCEHSLKASEMRIILTQSWHNREKHELIWVWFAGSGYQTKIFLVQ